jgi:general secretion pathway protein N
MVRRNSTPQTRSPWRLAWAGAVVGLVVSTVVFAPARWLAAGVQQLSGEQVQLTDARGSVWQGSAQLVLSGGEGSNGSVALPGLLAWQIWPSWGGLNAQVSAECCTRAPLQLNAALIGFGGLHFTLTDSQSQWPAGLLVGLGTPWNTVQPQGQLVVTSEGFGAQWAEGRLAMEGRVQFDATQMSSRLSTIAPMGSYRLTLHGGAPSHIALTTLEGSLQLSGQGQWVGQRLRFEGEASAAPDRVEALSNLLNILGRRDGARSIIKLG